MNLFFKNKNGQGLLEAIAAISVIIIGLVSVIAVSHSSLASHYEAETRMVAANLAREGAEAVHNIRDSNWLAGDAWDAGLFAGADYTGIPVITVSGNWQTENWQVGFGPNDFNDNRTTVYQYTAGFTGLYAQADGVLPGAQKTIYKRFLTLKAICESEGAESILDSASCSSGTKIGVRIISEIRWEEHGRSHSLTVEDSVYNWK